MKLRDVTIVAVAVILGWWYTNLQLRSRKLFQQLSVNWPSTIHVASFDQQSEAFRIATPSEWKIRDAETNGTVAQFITLQGMVPSVQNLTNVLSTPTQPYSWLNQSQNRKSIALGALKEFLHSMGTVSEGFSNPTIRVSDDGHMALLWCGENYVIMFEDDPNGLIYRRYGRRK